MTHSDRHSIQYKSICVGAIQTNAYIVYSGQDPACFIIDPGSDGGIIADAIDRANLRPEGIILTHGHYDHFGAVTELKKRYNIPVHLHMDDRETISSKSLGLLASLFKSPEPPEIDSYLADGDVLEAGTIRLKVIHTPGHTQGSICLDAGPILFTGDTLFQGSIGRTDLPGGDYRILQQSLEKLKQFPPATIILPGHGEESTIKIEVQLNPFL